MDCFLEFAEKAKTANVIPVVTTIPADLLTPLAVYLKLSKDAQNAFLLESVEGGVNLARFSFIGANPKAVISGDEKRTTIFDELREQSVDTPILNYLKQHLDRYNTIADSDLPAFLGGAIGFIGFSAAEWFEPVLKPLKPDNGEPDAMFMLFRSVIAFDHAKQLISVVSLVFTDEAENDAAHLENLFNKARSENERLKTILETENISLPTTAPSLISKETSNFERVDFENAVRTIKELIAAGECYQVVLSQCFTKPTAASPVSIYRAIRRLNPSPYMFLLKFGEKAVIGASPEMLVRCRGDELEYRPIAGTRPRGKTSQEDQRLANEMAADTKEIAEHQMLVDLGRNDLGRVAEYGSVKVAELMKVEKYSHVQHLVSKLAAKLRKGFDRFDALASCFPAGTVSGAPKVRAIQIITELEPTPRGVYAGAVGYFDYSGNMDTCIAIRTLVLENGVAKVQAGAGIVADSVPEREYEETVHKARALLKAVEIVESSEL
jgi:anthranilate synthase component 1